MAERSERLDVDGVLIDPWTQAELVEHVSDRIAVGAGGLVLTANADILRQLRRGSGAELASRADVVVADGMPLVWASRLQGTPVPERVAGADLVWSLAWAIAAGSGSLYLLGAAPGVAQAAGEAFAIAVPGLNVCGVSSPPPGFERDVTQWDAVVRDVTAAQPSLVYVALGHPRQEQVALRLLEHLPTTWFLGCGGALDMAAGRTRRAPVIFQALGGEWLHRLLLEPRRLARRYLVDDAPYVLGMLVRAAWARQRRRS